jgi:hypothetical protein
MTTDEARQLNVEIAEKVMGIPWKGGTPIPGYDGRWPWPPPYSTDPDAAQLVLGAWPGDVQVRRRNGAWECELFLPSKQWSDAGATLAEAVCRARLRAWRDAGL